jgi:hypothetical protein
MITSILLPMVHLVGEVSTLVHQIQKKDLNIFKIECMKYQPEDMLALLTLCDGFEWRYVTHQILLN